MSQRLAHLDQAVHLKLGRGVLQFARRQLTADIVELARTYGRYGYRRITALLRSAGWAVNGLSGCSASGGERG